MITCSWRWLGEFEQVETEIVASHLLHYTVPWVEIDETLWWVLPLFSLFNTVFGFI